MKTASALARRLVSVLTQQGMTVSIAESCTGGLIAKLITDIPGSSAVFPGACVTYTNSVKEQLLGVNPAVIARDTEVSEACAREMADGIRSRLGTSVGISTTGYAGPGGGTPANPVGTVYIAVSTERGTVCERFSAPVSSTRTQVRMSAARRAIAMALQTVENE